MKPNQIGKAGENQNLAVPSQVVFYNFASKNNLAQLSLYIAALKSDLLWLRKALDEELKVEKISRTKNVS